MNKMNVAIIEDEIPAARLLHSMVSGLRPQWELTLIPGSVDEAVAWFDEHPHPDLIFLDIHLADGNAFDFLSAAHPSSVIIFTTAYDQYAIRAFTVNSIDYILKPIDEKRLSDAITKYESLLTNAVPRPEDYRVESFFGRFNYNFNEKYYFSASIRTDGSSRFQKDNRWGTFWSVGANWRISQEKFMQNLTWISNLSAKISYGGRCTCMAK